MLFFLMCFFFFYIQGKVKKKVKNNSLVISGVSSAFFGFEYKQKPHSLSLTAACKGNA